MAGETHEHRLARWAKKGKPGEPPVPAATVILLRDGPDGLETLMLRRNSKLAFVGGMWVFPGGRVDPEDREGLLFTGQLPPEVTSEVFRELIGVTKHRAYLNYWYGVVLEEALGQLRVETRGE